MLTQIRQVYYLRKWAEFNWFQKIDNTLREEMGSLNNYALDELWGFDCIINLMMDDYN